ncbi:multiubiquitin domain-containing protein [Zavarzinella formosa]|uniref:multiubiquitin domain-containing protein n=1 Tax=Zavarzinella formosa TaxID=360055 RepID=UPI0002F23DAB|nr:multiubiquitin domain-containing protein [Zavarzinella formosa]
MGNALQSNTKGPEATGRPERSAANDSFRLAVSNETLNFRPLTIADPVPLGRQILAVAGYGPPDDFSLFAILPAGDFEDVRLDETFDLRGKGVERFVAFKSDRVFRLTLDGHAINWGVQNMPGAVLYSLANVGAGQAVFFDARGGQDRLIEPGDVVDLAAPGVEHFVTGPRPVPTFEIFVNGRPRTVTGNTVTFEQIVQLAFPGEHDPNVEFSMSYSHAAATPPVGELGRGGSVQIKNGTRFNVTRTVQS